MIRILSSKTTAWASRRLDQPASVVSPPVLAVSGGPHVVSQGLIVVVVEILGPPENPHPVPPHDERMAYTWDHPALSDSSTHSVPSVDDQTLLLFSALGSLRPPISHILPAKTIVAGRSPCTQGATSTVRVQILAVRRLPHIPRIGCLWGEPPAKDPHVIVVDELSL